jgi:hypothetical protein
VIFSATEMSRPDFCIAATSAFAQGFPLNVLGTRRQKQFVDLGPLDKLWALQEFVDNLPDEPNVIVAFIDAYGNQSLPNENSSVAELAELNGHVCQTLS